MNKLLPDDFDLHSWIEGLFDRTNYPNIDYNSSSYLMVNVDNYRARLGNDLFFGVILEMNVLYIDNKAGDSTKVAAIMTKAQGDILKDSFISVIHKAMCKMSRKDFGTFVDSMTNISPFLASQLRQAGLAVYSKETERTQNLTAM